MRNKSLWLFVLISFIIVLLVACRPDSGGDGQALPKEPTVAPTKLLEAPIEAPLPGLENVGWRLVSNTDLKGNRISVLPGTEITIEFVDGQVKGSAGCNSFFAVYVLDGDLISFSSAGITEMFCMSPQGIMEQEMNYLSALQDTVSYVITDGRLQLINAKGSTLLVFTR